jgi:amino-acid N-acetyltransferase
MYSIFKATESDFSEINRLLNSASLPLVEDSNCSRYFFVSKNTENKIIASIGLECYGQYGLLRSLAVSPDRPTTADKYFLKNGFEQVQRNEIPEELTHSQEYSSICPVSATTMRKLF